MSNINTISTGCMGSYEQLKILIINFYLYVIVAPKTTITNVLLIINKWISISEYKLNVNKSQLFKIIHLYNEILDECILYQSILF